MSLNVEISDGVAQIRLNDGKANALSHEIIAGLNEALDRAEREAASVLFVGRPGRFCAGFDLQTMGLGGEAAVGLVRAGGEFFCRLLMHPQPVVAACTGHAIAAGAIWLMACDVRIGMEGKFKIGLSEVQIGLPLPEYASEIARMRLSRRHFLAATTLARMYRPQEAVDAGYLDQVVTAESVEATAWHRAKELSAIAQPAFSSSKQGIQASLVRSLRDGLDADMARFEAGLAD